MDKQYMMGWILLGIKMELTTDMYATTWKKFKTFTLSERNLTQKDTNYDSIYAKLYSRQN